MSVKTCEQCGTEFGPKPHEGPKKWATRRFCGVACSRASMKGNTISKKHCNDGPCAVEWCDRKAVARGWCKRHWTQWRRSGDPLATEKPRKTDPPPVTPADEPLVILRPDQTGVTCPDCGRVYSATDDPNLLGAALANHVFYCQAKKKETAA